MQDDLGGDVADPRNGERCEIGGAIVEKLLLGSVEVSSVDPEEFKKVGVRACIHFGRRRLVDEGVEADIPALFGKVRVRGSARPPRAKSGDVRKSRSGRTHTKSAETFEEEYEELSIPSACSTSEKSGTPRTALGNAL